MKLKSVLREHGRFKSRGTLPLVLGDALLWNQNPAYARVRSLALKAGFRFMPAWESYRRASLFELQTILKKKQIPVNETVPTLRRLAKVYQINDEMDDVPVDLTSYHFHESAHGIADAVFKTFRAQGKQEKILLALLGESYASTCESFAVTFVSDEVQRFFLAQNSYIEASAPRTKQRRQAMRFWGSAGLFRLLWLSYLYSNFLVEDISPEELQGILRFALQKENLVARDLKLATDLFNDAYRLNVNFRLKTAQLYLRLLGIEGDVRRNLRFNFSQVFLRHARLRDGFDRLADMTSEGLSV